MNYLNNLSVKTKIYLMVTLAAVAVMFMAFRGAVELKQAMLDERRQQLQYHVELAQGVLKFYQAQVVQGQLPLEEAKQLAFTQLADMSYSSEGYFFAYDSSFILRSSLKGSASIGNNVANIQDSRGNYLYREIMQAAREPGGGYVEYYFPKQRGGEPLAKLSFATFFKPWSIVLGTGVYLDDVDAMFTDRLLDKSITFIAILLVLVGISVVIVRAIVNPLRHIQSVMKKVAMGDVTQRVTVFSEDEVGQMSRSLNTMLGSFQALLKELTSSLDKLNLSADDLAVIAEQTNTGVQSQTLEIETVVSAVEQMTLAVKEVEGSTFQASEATTYSNSVVNEASTMIEETIDAINQVAEQVEGAVKVVHELAAGSSEIGEVLNVISGISEQTNLLALNAAIEAARAGEAGRGFAVVADEVRSLAHSTKGSTIEIQQMIEKLQDLAKSATRVMEAGRNSARESVIAAGKTGENLKQVVIQVEKVNDMNRQIASATTEQAAVAEEVSRAMINISAISQQTGDGSHQTLGNSDNVKSLAQGVNKQVAAFIV